jgi:hypothetical protein
MKEQETWTFNWNFKSTGYSVALHMPAPLSPCGCDPVGFDQSEQISVSPSLEASQWIVKGECRGTK